MKKADPHLRRLDPGYRLKEIFLRTIDDFYAAEKGLSDLEANMKRGKQVSPTELLRLSESRRETGVIAVLTASAYLEETLYLYAIRHIDAKAFDTHLRTLSTFSKWLLLPRLCENKTIDESDLRLKALDRLIKVRNVITHPKHLVGDGAKPLEKWLKNSDEFLEVVRSLEKTVAEAKDLLK